MDTPKIASGELQLMGASISGGNAIPNHLPKRFTASLRSLLSHQCQRHSSKERRCQVVRIPTYNENVWAFCTKSSQCPKVALGLRTHTWLELMCCCWETKAWRFISQGPRSCQIRLTNGWWRGWSTTPLSHSETERTHLGDLKSTESGGSIHCAYLVGLSVDLLPVQRRNQESSVVQARYDAPCSVMVHWMLGMSDSCPIFSILFQQSECWETIAEALQIDQPSIKAYRTSCCDISHSLCTTTPTTRQSANPCNGTESRKPFTCSSGEVQVLCILITESWFARAAESAPLSDPEWSRVLTRIPIGHQTSESQDHGENQKFWDLEKGQRPFRPQNLTLLLTVVNVNTANHLASSFRLLWCCWNVVGYDFTLWFWSALFCLFNYSTRRSVNLYPVLASCQDKLIITSELSFLWLPDSSMHCQTLES